MKSLKLDLDDIAKRSMGTRLYKFFLEHGFDDEEESDAEFAGAITEYELEQQRKKEEAIKKAKETRERKKKEKEKEERLKKIRAINEAILKEMAQRILLKSLYYCPINTGALRRSARLKFRQGGATIEYGNDEVTYAPYVHEIEEFHHQSPTQAKFLEDAGVEVQEEMNYMLTDADRELGIELPEIRMIYNNKNGKVAMTIGIAESTLKSFKINTRSLKDVTSEKNEFRSGTEIYDIAAIDYTTLEGMQEGFYTDLWKRMEAKEYTDITSNKALIAYYLNAGGKFLEEGTK